MYCYVHHNIRMPCPYCKPLENAVLVPWFGGLLVHRPISRDENQKPKEGGE